MMDPAPPTHEELVERFQPADLDDYVPVRMLVWFPPESLAGNHHGTFLHSDDEAARAAADDGGSMLDEMWFEATPPSPGVWVWEGVVTADAPPLEPTWVGQFRRPTHHELRALAPEATP